MKRLLLSLVLILSCNSALRAEDPKANQISQGISAVQGTVTAIGAAVAYFSECSATAIPACLLGALATTAGVAQVGIAVYSFVAADNLDSGGQAMLPERFNSEGRLPSDNNFNHLQPIPVSTLKDAALQKVESAQAKLESIKAQGLISDEMIANPEKFLTPEDLAEFNAGKEKLTAELQEENGASQETLQVLLDGSESDGFQTASLTMNDGGAFASGFGSLGLYGDLDGLLGLKERGIQNSAPGYYGNVSLKSLRPESKMSLFERVSLKLKHEMGRKSISEGNGLAVEI